MAAFAELLNPVHSPEKQKVLNAIASHGPRIVPVEVATDTGMALPAVMTQLNTIASETNAHLEVTETGNIAYLFQPNLAQAYTANASRQIMQSIGRVIANISIIVLRAFCALMFFLVRISFGIALILGAVFIVVLVIVGIMALIKGLGGDNDSGGGGDGGFNFDFGSLFDFGWGGGYYGRPFYMYWIWDWIWDWFYFWRYVSPSDSYYQPETIGTYDAGYGQVGGKKEEKRNFLMNVFTYLFGDGNPNKNFEEQEWQAIAQVIEGNQGVVTAEMLAPYAGEDPADEDWMVHVLQRFNGVPEVGESGGIIYTFPAFQTSGMNFDPGPVNQSMSGEDLNNLYRGHLKKQSASQIGGQKLMHLDRALTEKTWPFMPIGGGTVTLIITFGLIILLGSIFLLTQHLVFGSLYYAVYVLFGYGMLFFVIPAIRWVIYNQINNDIEKRNTDKLEYAAKLNNPDQELQKKLEEARTIRISGVPKKADSVVYTTEKDTLDQPDLDSDDDYRLPPGQK